MNGPYFEGQRKLECGHYFPDVITIVNKKLGDKYIKILDCKICGRVEISLNSQDISSHWKGRLDREGTIITIEENKIEEFRQSHLERLTSSE